MDNNNLEHNWNMFQNKKSQKTKPWDLSNETSRMRPLGWDLSKFYPPFLLGRCVWAKKSKGRRHLGSAFLDYHQISFTGLEKNGIIQTILQNTEIGGSIGTKIKKMVLTPLGSSIISRIPGSLTAVMQIQYIRETIWAIRYGFMNSCSWMKNRYRSCNSLLYPCFISSFDLRGFCNIISLIKVGHRRSNTVAYQFGAFVDTEPSKCSRPKKSLGQNSLHSNIILLLFS